VESYYYQRMHERNKSFALQSRCNIFVIFYLILINKSGSIYQLTEIWSHINNKNFKLSAIEYSQFLKHCQTPQHLQLGKEIVQHIQINLPQQQIDTILRTSIALSLTKCGDPSLAVEMWKNELQVDRKMYSVFLMACIASGRYFHSPIIVSHVYFCRFDIGKEIHAHIKLHEFQFGSEVLSHLARMYTKFNEPEQVKQLWDIIISKKIVCTDILYNTILVGCANWAKKYEHDIAGASENSPSLQLGKSIHKHMVKSRIMYGFKPTIVSNYLFWLRWNHYLYNNLMNVYTRCGQTQLALSIWREMLKHKGS
jgi:pentatricopeptide repeat protein